MTSVTKICINVILTLCTYKNDVNVTVLKFKARTLTMYILQFYILRTKDTEVIFI